MPSASVRANCAYAIRDPSGDQQGKSQSASGNAITRFETRRPRSETQISYSGLVSEITAATRFPAGDTAMQRSNACLSPDHSDAVPSGLTITARLSAHDAPPGAN